MSFASRSRRAALSDISTPRVVREIQSQNLVPDSFLTPSPDEEIIRSRSRRSVAQSSREAIKSLAAQFVESDEEDDDMTVEFIETPPKTSGDQQQPRKRLVLSPKKSEPKGLSQPKKQRIQRKKKIVPLSTELKSLTSDQLVEMIEKLVTSHPELEEEIRNNIPLPDLKPLEDKLHYLERNIFKSFPNTRWGSNRDAFCYRRVKTHLEAFKKSCIDQGKNLVVAQSYESAIRYVLMAWNYVDRMPHWDDSSHNKSKEMCFKNLASQCMTSLKKSALEKETYREFRKSLEDAAEVNNEIDPCLQQVNKILDKLT